MEKRELKHIVEAALLAAGRPVNVENLLDLFEGDARPEAEELSAALEELNGDYAGRGRSGHFPAVRAV